MNLPDRFLLRNTAHIITDSAPEAAVINEFEQPGIKLTIAPTQEQA
ncbi:hypothetical protein [Rhizobium bangladeshense]|nr:hypothetical protein [Rhizobium bangladeshense]